MASGRNNHLTRQIGEHLVTAELGRMDFIATPFAGNVPGFDLLVANEVGDAVPVQVKTIRKGAWQFQADTFLDIVPNKHRQIVNGRLPLRHPHLVCVFVHLVIAGKDEFFTLTLKDLQDHFACNYKGRKRPKNINSMHCAIWPKDLQKYRGWDALLLALKSTRRKLKRGPKPKSK